MRSSAMAQLTEWLRIMLGEIARKRDDAEHAREEEARRQREARESADQNVKRPDTDH
jgi:hypothetical protein